jgi:uncharacterized repeat protein (TIGR03803 family)
MKLTAVSVRPRFSKAAWLFLLMMGATFSATAQSFSVAHSFSGATDGANPLSGLVSWNGALYGTASAGGSGAGLVYKITADTGVQSVVYTFTGKADGATPESALVAVSGSLYGTTSSGGAHSQGTVYSVTSKGKETVLYSFSGAADGAGPEASLVADAAGNLYGTTFSGGANGKGTVFELVRPTSGSVWTLVVLHTFGSGKDGANPVAGVSFDRAGNLYGTTSKGGAYTYGTVFQLTSSSSGWTETILHSFQSQADGATPYAGIVVSSNGSLYGAATAGGAGGSNGGGTIFSMTKSGSAWSFNVLYKLAGWGVSGSFRNVMMSSGKIYATTHCDGAHTAGTIYELTPSGNSWTYRQLYTFTGGSDGLYSFSNLAPDGKGYLWGTTNLGGGNGAGVVFKIKP